MPRSSGLRNYIKEETLAIHRDRGTTLTLGTEQCLIICKNKKYIFLLTTTLTISVIWIVLSLIQGSKKEGTSWMDPYKRRMRDHPVITAILVIIIIALLL